MPERSRASSRATFVEERSSAARRRSRRRPFSPPSASEGGFRERPRPRCSRCSTLMRTVRRAALPVNSAPPPRRPAAAWRPPPSARGLGLHTALGQVSPPRKAATAKGLGCGGVALVPRQRATFSHSPCSGLLSSCLHLDTSRSSSRGARRGVFLAWRGCTPTRGTRVRGGRRRRAAHRAVGRASTTPHHERLRRRGRRVSGGLRSCGATDAFVAKNKWARAAFSASNIKGASHARIRTASSPRVPALTPSNPQRQRAKFGALARSSRGLRCRPTDHARLRSFLHFLQYRLVSECAPFKLDVDGYLTGYAPSARDRGAFFDADDNLIDAASAACPAERHAGPRGAIYRPRRLDANHATLLRALARAVVSGLGGCGRLLLPAALQPAAEARECAAHSPRPPPRASY